ncbi:MAG: hypothetical protein HY908_25760 [Myxococcales bacterium]|nr:hypothetical protein [Myxococcales bacterium]
MSVAERAQELAERVIGPLLLGGPLRPVRPIGLRLAQDLVHAAGAVDDAWRVEVQACRVRRARALAPVDTLADLSAAEWGLAAAFNDILQTTNHELSTFATRGRHLELCRSCHELCAAIPPPASVLEAVARHATFGRAFELTRQDTEVSWWTGSARYRGQKPPQRLLYWKDLRNVRVSTTPVALLDMDEGVPITDEDFAGLIAAWLGVTPLTDLALVARVEPAFAWTRASLSLVASPVGRDLALRAFAQREPSYELWRKQCRQDADAAVEALGKATATLRPGTAPRAVAEAFVGAFRQAAETWVAEAR